MKWFKEKSFLRRGIICPALTGFCNLSVPWHRTILCLTNNRSLNRHVKKYARSIGYNFLDTVQEPVLVRDCFRDITIIDKSIFSTRFWQGYLNIQKLTHKDSDKQLLIIVDAPRPSELQETESLIIRVFRVNYSIYHIIEIIGAFVLYSLLKSLNRSTGYPVIERKI